MKYDTNPYLQHVYLEGRADVVLKIATKGTPLPSGWNAPSEGMFIPRALWLELLCERPVVEPVKEDY